MIPLAVVALVRLVRDRSNLFFVLILPVMLVALLGLQFGGEPPGPVLEVAGSDGTVRDTVVELLVEDGFEVVVVDDASAALSAVDDGAADAAVLLPDVEPGETVVVEVVTIPDGDGAALRTRVDAAVTTATAPLRARQALSSLGLEVADDALPDAGVVELVSTTVDEPDGDSLAEQFEGLGQFDLGASSQLLLFVFITTLNAAAGVVQARRWGVLDRIVAGPTRPVAVVAGLALGQLVVALVQSLVIIAVTAAVFDVNWGDPVATAAVVVSFSSVAAAGGLLLGAVLDSEERVGGFGPPIALVLAALGGSMLPLELFPDWLRGIANITPHAWGNTAFAEIVRRDAGFVDVLPNVAVLLGFTLAIGAAATVLLRRGIARG